MEVNAKEPRAIRTQHLLDEIKKNAKEGCWYASGLTPIDVETLTALGYRCAAMLGTHASQGRYKVMW